MPKLQKEKEKKRCTHKTAGHALCREQRRKRKRRLCERAKKSALASYSRVKAAAAAAALHYCTARQSERDLWRKCCHCCCCCCCWPPTTWSETETRHQWSRLQQQATFIDFVCPVNVTSMKWGLSVSMKVDLHMNNSSLYSKYSVNYLSCIEL